MNQAKLKFIRRQYNKFKVPYPMVEGLVFVSFGGPQTVENIQNHIETLKYQIYENELAKIIERN